MRAVDQKPEYHLQWPNNELALLLEQLGQFLSVYISYWL